MHCPIYDQERELRRRKLSFYYLILEIDIPLLGGVFSAGSRGRRGNSHLPGENFRN
jgi:hypothetical protein